MRKSFILHIDSLGILDELSDEQCGQLFRLIYEFHNPNKPKQTQITQVVKLAFHSFKTQFERDLQTYENVVERNKKNGLLGGRPKNKNPKKPKKPDSDSKSDSDSKNKNDIDRRKTSFAESLKTYSTEYGSEMIEAFFTYWSEQNKSGNKMRFEMERTWELNLRLKKWANNQKAFNKGSNTPKDKPVTITIRPQMTE